MKAFGRLHLVTLLSGLLMELGAVYPLALYFASERLSAWIFLLYLALGLVAGWVIYAEVQEMHRLRLWLIGVGVVAAFVIPLGFHLCRWDAALMLGLAYWRGLTLSQYSENPRAVQPAVMSLVGIMVGTLALQLVARRPPFEAAAAPYYLLFFAGGLAALAAARADLLRRRWEGGMKRREQTVQASMALLGILLIVVPAVLVWALATPYFPFLAHAMVWIGSNLVIAVAYVVTFILYYPIKAFAAWIMGHQMPPPQDGGPSETQMAEDLMRLLQEKGGGAYPEWIPRLIGFLAIAGAAALVLVWVYRQIGRRYRLGADDGIPEERVSLRSLPSSGADLRPAARPQAETLTGETVAIRVRRLYRRLQQAGSKAGRGRRPGETPLEYARELAGTTLGGAAAAVTDLYQQVRYAEGEPERRQVDEAERMVER